MHDITDLESHGMVGMFVASTEFIEAAEAQSKALGFDPAVVFVPHPIQDRTDDEIRQIADQAFEAILAEIIN